MDKHTEEDILRTKNEIIDNIMSTSKTGKEKLIDYLENKTDYFECPSSSKFHGNHEYGLMIHSYNVKNELEHLNERYNLGLTKDNIIITAYLHDLCKANTYEYSIKLRKNVEDKWEGYTTYIVEDSIPIGGHSYKSIALAQQFIHLTLQECLMIAHHMGGFLPKEMHGDMHKAMSLYKGVAGLQIADQCASNFLEETVEPTIVTVEEYNKFMKNKKAGA